MNWAEPPVIEDAIWVKKTQSLQLKTKKPLHINKKIKRILADVRGGKQTKDGPSDPYSRWMQIDSRERAEVEAVLGKMPEGNLSDASREDAIHYSVRDSDATGRVEAALWPMIVEKGMEGVFWMDMETLPIALEMEKNGIKINIEKLHIMGEEWLARLQELSEEIFDLLRIPCVGCGGTQGDDSVQAIINSCIHCNGSGIKRFNPNSNHQLATLFFTDLGFTPTKYTKTGMPSVAKGELSKIDHPVVGKIEEYRHVQHLKDSFSDTLPGKADSNSRVHPTIKTTRTATGRWSMADPNPQQAPSRDPEGRRIREAFEAEAGNVLVAIDHSQIEMRVAAHVTQCKSMIEIFQQGRHIHKETMAEIFNIPLEDVDQDSTDYKATKNIGFGVLYMETASGLFTQLAREKAEGWTLERCEQFIKDYYLKRPEIWTWQEETKGFVRRNGWVEDMFGRRRLIPEALVPVDWIRSAGERQACNMPIQAGAQGILKLGMVAVDKELKAQKVKEWVKWILQVHDELVWEIPAHWVDWFVPMACKLMEDVVQLTVPLKVEAKVGINWRDMEKVAA